MKLDEQLVKGLFNQIDGKRSSEHLEIFHEVIKNLDTEDKVTNELFTKFKDSIAKEESLFKTVDVLEGYVVLKDGKLLNLLGENARFSLIFQTKKAALSALTSFFSHCFSEVHTWDNSVRFTEYYNTDAIEVIRAKNVFKTGKNIQKYLLERKIVEIVSIEEYYRNRFTSKI